MNETTTTREVRVMMTVDAYMVEWVDTGDTAIVPADEVVWDVEDWTDGERYALHSQTYGNKTYGHPCVLLSALSLWRSVDHGARTADGTALEVIGEVCETIVEPVLMWMCEHGWGRQWQWQPCDYLAALNAERGIEWDGSGWMPAPDGVDVYASHDEPLYGQGCEQDMCEDVWSACGGVVWTDADCGMTWMYVTLEDYTR